MIVREDFASQVALRDSRLPIVSKWSGAGFSASKISELLGVDTAEAEMLVALLPEFHVMVKDIEMRSLPRHRLKGVSWRDPESDDYDPLRVMLEQKGIDYWAKRRRGDETKRLENESGSALASQSVSIYLTANQ
jgi:hypothetical protein